MFIVTDIIYLFTFLYLIFKSIITTTIYGNYNCHP